MLKAALVAFMDGLLRAAFVLSPRLYRKANVAELQPARILLSRPDHIGDAILAMPALRNLRARFPDAHITMMVASWSAELFRHNRDADRLMVTDTPWWLARRNRGLGARAKLKSWLALAATIREIRRGRYDVLIELRGDVRHIVAFGCLGGVRHILTYRRNGGHFLADRWLPVRSDRHEMLQDLDLVALLGGKSDTTISPLHGAQEAAAIDRVFESAAISAAHIVVVIHPGAKKVNQWPLEHYANLVRNLLLRADVRVIVTGGPSEDLLAQSLEPIEPSRVFSVAGQLSMLEMAALLARTDILVSADTGPMHLVNIYHTPSVLLFGPTRPQRFAPMTASTVIVAADRCCNEALHEVCLDQPEAPYSACMSSISVETVLAALGPLLERPTRVREAINFRA